VTILSASIVAFSASVLSIKELNLHANRTLLGASWSLFAATVVVGPASIALEARAKYVIECRAIQPQEFDANRRLTLLERAQLLAILSYSIAIRPRSLFYARDTDFNVTKPTQGMRMNLCMVLAPHKVWDFALALELVLWVLFSAAMITLVIALFP
jgi:hypothetical protein